MATARLTKLNAINTMLEAISEQPINQLDETVSVDVALAVDTLDLVSREVQSVGWEFNTEEEVPMTPNVDGYIVVAPNILTIDPSDPTQNCVRRYQDSKDYLYDKDNKTFIFDDPLDCDVTYLFDFVALPPTCQTYIMMKATRKFQSKLEGDVTQYKFTKEDENDAFLIFKKTEGETGDYNMITGNAEMYDIAGR